MNTVLRDKKFLAKAEILAYTGVCLLLIGFLFNRVVNNIGFFLIAVYTLIRIREAKKLLQDPWMNSFVLIAMVPWVSDLLLEGTRFYLYRGDMKLMLPVFPLFFMAWQPSDRDIRRISILFLVLMAVSTVYSMYHYLTDFKNMYMTYKQSGVVLTLSKKDHIRIGWATAVSCLLAADMARKSPFRWSGGLLYLYAAAQFGFLHVLGSKTGLLLLYAGLLIYLIWSLPGQRKWMAAVQIPLMMAVPVIAYKTIPSFEQRVNFIKYDFEYYSRRRRGRPADGGRGGPHALPGLHRGRLRGCLGGVGAADPDLRRSPRRRARELDQPRARPQRRPGLTASPFEVTACAVPIRQAG